MGAKAGRVIRNEDMEIVTAHLELRTAEPNAPSLMGPGSLHAGGKVHRLAGNPAFPRARGDGDDVGRDGGAALESWWDPQQAFFAV